MTFWFDMDGTIVNLYGVKDWLQYLHNENTTPYEIATPLVNMSRLAKAIHKAQRNGNQVGIISWTCKGGSKNYNAQVAQAKLEWLHKHLPSVKWNAIQIVEYGVEKQTLAKIGDVLFDDELANRTNWGERAYTPKDIFAVLAD